MKLFIAVFFLTFSFNGNAQSGYAYKVKQYFLYSQQQRISMAYMYEKSTTGKGQTVLLLHGKNFSGWYWNATMKCLLEHGYDVLVPDQVGFGLSDMPQRYQYSFQQLASNTKSLADSLGIKKMIVLGHSMGGMMAIRLALMYPDICAQLILEDPIGLEDWKRMTPYSPIDTEYKKELAKTKESVKKYMLDNYFHGEWRSDYDSLLYHSTTSLKIPANAWSMALTSDMIFTQPVCYEFSLIKVPTVLLIGLLDKTAIGKERVDSATASQMGNYPLLGKKVAALIPFCRLMELEGIGHVPHVENFELFKKYLLDILK